MCDLKICRICLCKDAKMFDKNRHHLNQYYEEIMTMKVSNIDELPHYFCYMCATMLQKFHKFKEKCHTGQKILQELIWTGPITPISISQIDQLSKSLKSPIDIITRSKRVKTLCIKNKLLSHALDKNDKITQTEEIKSDDSDNDNASDDENLAEIKHIIINKEKEVIDNKQRRNDVKYETILSVGENPLPDFVDDRMYSDEDDLNTEPTDIEKIIVKEEVFEDLKIHKEKSNQNTEEIKTIEIPTHDINKVRKLKEKPLPDVIDERMYSDKDYFSTEPNDIEKINVKEVYEDPKINKEISSQNTEEIKSIEKPTHDNNKVRKRKPGKSKKEPVAKKARKFELKEKTNYLDPKHWLKINLTEGEALEEFKAREKDLKYIKLAYKCTLCLKGFSKEDMLTRHNKLRHSKSIGPIECHFCSMRFKLKCHLSRHIRQHYTKYKCLRCELMCPLETTALFHNEFHNGVVRKCKFCGEEFRHPSSFYTHLRLHRSEHVCTLCGASFVSALGLQLHKKTMHIDIVIDLDDEGTYCERCDIKFETRKAYEQHFAHSAMHGGGETGAIETDPTVSTNNDAKGRTDTLKKKIVDFKRRSPRIHTPCTICHKIFPSMKAYMKHHKAQHTDEPISKRIKYGERTICEICGASLACPKKFPSLKAYMKHHMAQHTAETISKTTKSEERIICEICGASLAPGSVKSHLNAHTSEQIFTCPTCGREFRNKGSMERHQLVHTGEKPHKCSLCEKRFTQHGSVKLHYRTVHLKQPHPKRNRRKKTSSEPVLELEQK